MSLTDAQPVAVDTRDVADRLLFGAAYYPEYTSLAPEDVARDFDLMQQAGFTVIRVGESVWSTWEPTEGAFELGWLTPILDEAFRRGISVILGTPTYAVPPWLQVKHPEIAGQDATGRPIPWGGRQEVDISSPTFRRYARRVIERIIGAHADHPAVIGFQVDNEPGQRILYNPGVFAGFVRHLRDKFDTVERLNDEWGLAYWSHRLSDWNELWVPDGNTLPQYDLEWRRYQAELTTEFIAWQVDLVRPLIGDHQFITTCISYKRPSLHDGQLGGVLDIVAANTYHGEQGALDAGSELERLPHRETSGVWGLLRQADRAYSSGPGRFLVTELGAQSTGPSHANYPPHPGQLSQAALALVSRGAAMIEYWHLNSLRWGTETYWGGILPHSGKPGRIYGEIAELGHRLRRLRPHLVGFTPAHDVTFVYSPESKWAMEFTPPLSTSGQTGDSNSYHTIFDAVYRGFSEVGAQMRILHLEQLDALSADQLLREHPVLVLAGTYITSRELLEKLRDYALLGGHLVMTPRAGYADELARVHREVAPAYLSDAAGVRYEEFSNLRSPIAVESEALDLDDGAAGLAWIDGLLPNEAEVLLTYNDRDFARFVAATSRTVSKGRITVLGTLPNPPLARSFARWVQPRTVAQDWLIDAAPGIGVCSGINAAGETIVFVFNWTGDDVVLRIGLEVTEIESGATLAKGSPLPLSARGAAVLRP